MQHFSAFEQINLRDAWVTIGSFDGVHLGHQALIRGLVTEAHASGSPAVVVTFYPHPAVVLRRLEGSLYLSSPDERAAMLGELGVDAVLTMEFNQQLAQQSAKDFVAQLSQQLGMQKLWVGYNFALGRGREGDIPKLTNLGKEFGYRLEVVPPYYVDGEVVSSSLIREYLIKGNVGHAGMLLGRHYALEGQVIHGDGRGRLLGIPTANLDVWSERVIPANGIYACVVVLDDKRHLAVTNVGIRPTFENESNRIHIEAHLLDFNQDLYGNKIRLEFVEWLREERKYTSLETLVAQIHLDIHQAQKVLTNEL